MNASHTDKNKNPYGSLVNFEKSKEMSAYYAEFEKYQNFKQNVDKDADFFTTAKQYKDAFSKLHGDAARDYGRYKESPESFDKPAPAMLDGGNSMAKTFAPIQQEIKKIDLNYIRSYKDNTSSTLGPIEHYTKSEGIIPKDGKIDRDNTVVGHGSSQLYTLAMRHLIENKGDAIIVPVPTYGLFLPQIEKAGGTVIPVPLNKENGYTLTSEMIQDAIDFQRCTFF